MSYSGSGDRRRLAQRRRRAAARSTDVAAGIVPRRADASGDCALIDLIVLSVR
jgi:hypothetical protein